MLKAMWTNRSRVVTRKKTSMADHRSQAQATPTFNHIKACTSIFGYPNFRAFTTKCLSGKETLKSPTAVLESKPFSILGNTLSSHNQRSQPTSPATPCSQSTRLSDCTQTKGIGLAMIDSLEDDLMKESCSSSCKAKVLFGTQLRVQIPDGLPPPHFPSVASLKHPAEFGIKTKNLHVSTKGATDSGIYSSMDESADNFSISEMELSEDYTCVIYHGSIQKTTRIFYNYILESYCSLPNDNTNSDSENFLSFCYTCKKNLDLEKDIFLYRGERAFCSHACRHQEMLLNGTGRAKFVDDLSVEIS